MSGKPSPDGVETFRIALGRMTVADERCSRLESDISRLQAELVGQREEFNKAKELMFQKMSEMDVLPNGNAGYESRAGYFSRELYRQMRA